MGCLERSGSGRNVRRCNAVLGGKQQGDVLGEEARRERQEAMFWREAKAEASG